MNQQRDQPGEKSQERENADYPKATQAKPDMPPRLQTPGKPEPCARNCWSWNAQEQQQTPPTADAHAPKTTNHGLPTTGGPTYFFYFFHQLFPERNKKNRAGRWQHCGVGGGTRIASPKESSTIHRALNGAHVPADGAAGMPAPHSLITPLILSLRGWHDCCPPGHERSETNVR